MKKISCTFSLFAVLGFRSTLLRAFFFLQSVRAPQYFGYRQCCQNWATFILLPRVESELDFYPPERDLYGEPQTR